MDLHLIPGRGRRPPRSARPSTPSSGPPALGMGRRSAAAATRGPPRDRRRRDPRASRHLLLPALWAAQSRAGWISPGALNYICRGLSVAPADAYGVATFYAMFSVAPQPKTIVHVCDDLACRLAGARSSSSRCASRCPTDAAAAVSVPRPLRAGAGGPRSRRRARARRTTPSRRRARFPLTPAVSPPGGRGSRGFPRPRVRAGEPGSPSAPQTLDARHAKHCACSPASGRVDPESLDDYRAHGGYEALAEGVRARARGHDPRGPRLEAPGPRRRGLPGRPQVGGRGEAARAPALPRLQRRRVRARHLQGPRPHGGGPLRRRRGDDDRRLRDGLRDTATSTSAASTRSRSSALEGAIAAARARGAARVERRSGRTSPSTSRSAAAPAPTSAARRPRSSTRSRASAASRATSRPSRSRRASSASRPSSTTSRRSSTCLPIVARGRRRLRRDRHRSSRRARSSSASRATSRGPASTRSPSARRFASSSTLAGGVPGGPRGQGRAPRRRGRLLRRARRARRAADLRGHARDRRLARLGRRHGLRRPRRPARTPSGASPPSSATSPAASACPAASGPSARRSSWRASPRGGRSGSMAQELALLDEMARAMKDASICGLGQTASGAIQSAIGKLGVFGAREGMMPATSASTRASAGRADDRRRRGRPSPRARRSSRRAARGRSTRRRSASSRT